MSSDIYSLGVVVHAVYNQGKPVYQSHQSLASCKQHISEVSYRHILIILLVRCGLEFIQQSYELSIIVEHNSSPSPPPSPPPSPLSSPLSLPICLPLYFHSLLSFTLAHSDTLTHSFNFCSICR